MTAPPRVGDSPTIIALEEHWWPPELAAALERLPPDRRDEGLVLFNGGERERRLGDLGEPRLRDMDTQGVDKAVVSVTTPATQPLAPAEAVAIAREANDQAAAAVAAHPDRLAAFATLPTPDPEAAADELERRPELRHRHRAVRDRERRSDHEFSCFRAIDRNPGRRSRTNAHRRTS